MRSPFLKELQNNQELFINSRLLSGKGNPMERFYCRYLEIPIDTDKTTYLTWKSDTEIRILMGYVSHKLGIFLSLSDVHMVLYVQFPYKGFFCYCDFYGELRRQITKRLQFEFGSKIPLNDDAKIIYIGRRKRNRKNTKKILFDDLDLD